MSENTCDSASYNYDEVLRKSLLFYEAQRSGELPQSQRVKWRKDSALNDAKDADSGEWIDLEGGYYDAGDYVKFGFPMAAATTVLAWGAIENKRSYKDAGEWKHMKEAVKWATDYFIKAHVSDFVFYGQVGNGELDHAYWGRPEDMTMKRPAYKITKDKPGSDLAGETAAALAAASILFRDSDPTYADDCLQHAKKLYEFADTYRGKYSDSITDAKEYYKSWGGYEDELAWSAVWLYRATKEDFYLKEAAGHYEEGIPYEFSWDQKAPGVQVLLAQLTNETKYKKAITSFCDYIINDKPRTPKGLVYISQWGSLRYASNAAFVCLRAAAQGIKPDIYRDFAKKQIHYILGDAGRSFVVGFGHNPPERPHHASSSCPDPPASCDWSDYNSLEPNNHILYGALIGGPDINDFYEDMRDDYIMNEVTCDYNAGFQSAVAELRSLYCA
ncbi:endoglucanase A-like [Oratosquilla oratoria]|uniref:endoglucanase A-like n=1 Tax=Oratosquilla oratoria TaxID=337810 RepID=UPI003F7671D6